MPATSQSSMSHSQPTTSLEPAASQPATTQPTKSSPAISPPTTPQPSTSQSATSQSATSHPTIPQAVVSQPITSQDASPNVRTTAEEIEPRLDSDSLVCIDPALKRERSYDQHTGDFVHSSRSSRLTLQSCLRCMAVSRIREQSLSFISSSDFGDVDDLQE